MKPQNFGSEYCNRFDRILNRCLFCLKCAMWRRFWGSLPGHTYTIIWDELEDRKSRIFLVLILQSRGIVCAAAVPEGTQSLDFPLKITTVLAAEFFGVYQAMKIALRMCVKKVVIITASLHTYRLLKQAPPSHCLVNRIHSLAYDPVFISLKILWCPVHIGHPLNELVHVEAGKALG